MDNDLLAHIRFLVEDSGDSPVISDAQIFNVARNRRRLVYYESLATEDYLTWYHSRNYIEVISLADGYEGTAYMDPPSGDYTSDPIEGSFTFDEEQSTVYLHGYVYDLMDIVSQCWLVKGGLLDTYPGMTYTLGDETVSKGEAKEYCVQQYWRYKTSKGGQLSRR
jgi:hypothetical protein